MSIVPGFAQRYPRYDDDFPSWRDKLVLESCCTTLEEARSAQYRGADRIELCVDLSVGGITPPRDLIREAVTRLSIPVNVLIRPATQCAGTQVESGFSASDFVYCEEDLRQMIEDIIYCREAGAAGIVVGALTPEGSIALPAMKRLIAVAKPLPVTFHRAFDVCTQDPFEALDQIISLGCARLLTSGQAPTAWEGRGLIRLLVRRACGRIIVMPGRGVTPAILQSLASATQAEEFHGTAIP